MKFLKNVLLTSFIAFLLISCDGAGLLVDVITCEGEESCKNLTLAKILLSDRVNAIFKYKESDTLLFKNNQNDTLFIKASHPPKYNKIRTERLKLLCTSCSKGKQYEFYNFEYSEISFFSIGEHELNKFEISARTAKVPNVSTTSKLFYEELTITANMKIVDYERINIISKTHEKKGIFPLYFLSQSESYSFFDSITLLNQEYKNVYTNPDNENSIIYFSFEKGVIGFNIDNEIWLFDSIL